MFVRTPADLGALIRHHRIKLGLDQKTLAQKVGVSRQWIVGVEKGKPRAEIGLLLRTVGVLGIELETYNGSQAKSREIGTITSSDVDSIIAAARGEKI